LKAVKVRNLKYVRRYNLEKEVSAGAIIFRKEKSEILYLYYGILLDIGIFQKEILRKEKQK